MDPAQRRLPIYLLLDCSESMVGEPMAAVNRGLQLVRAALRGDPIAIETAWISVITFARGAHQVCPLTDVLQFQPPTLDVGLGTNLGAGLRLLGQCIKREVRRSTPDQKGDWKPVVFLLTDGQPTDDWKAGLEQFRTECGPMVVNLIAVGCGDDSDMDVLRAITPNALRMEGATSGDFGEFFKWVSTSTRVASARIAGGANVELPPPPAGATGGPGAEAGRPASQVILSARCGTHKRGYLMRYRRADPEGQVYQAEEKAYPVGPDYFAESMAGPSGRSLDSGNLKGSPPCPHCGAPGWAPATDGPGLVCAAGRASGGGRAQVLFVLDVTGSMEGEIGGVKDNIKGFTDFIRKGGLSVEVGLIAFRDLEFDEPPEVLLFQGGPFTDDAAAFKKRVSKLKADGGGFNPGESSLDALALACRQPFAPGVGRILILITDEPPLLPDGEVRTFDDVTRALKRAGIDQLHLVIPESLRGDYEPLRKGCPGKYFELEAGGRGGKAFRDVLLDVGKSITVDARLG